MTFQIFVGVDVSKLTIDAFIRERLLHRQFDNDTDGFVALIGWLEKQTAEPTDSMLICFEHTGVYSLPLAVFLEERRIQVAISAEPAGQARQKSKWIHSLPQ